MLASYLLYQSRYISVNKYLFRQTFFVGQLLCVFRHFNFIGASNSHDILHKGHVFFYIHKGGKFSFTSYSYGMCSIVRSHEEIRLVLFNNPEDIIYLPLDDNTYTFYSEISLVPHDSLGYLESAVQAIFNKYDKTLLNHSLLKRNLLNTFPSLSAFLTFLLSLPISNGTLVNELLKEGAELFISEENKIQKHLLIKNFRLGYLSINKTVELVITIDLPKEHVLSRSYSFVFFLNNLKHCQKIQSKELEYSEVELRNILQKKFSQILDLGCIEVLDYIFDVNKNLLNKSDNQSNAIHVAASKSSPDIFEYILTDFNNWEIKDENDNNLLHTCLLHKMYDNLYILMKSIPLPILNRLLFAKNGTNLTPFKAMMRDSSAQLSIELAVEKGCHDKNENNFIHLAIMNRNMIFLQSILKAKFKDFLFTHQNNLGRTPIQLAIKDQEVQAVSILLKHSIVSLPLQDCDGCNSLHTAILYYNHEIFGYLIKSVIDHDKKLINYPIKLNSPIYANSALTPVLLSIRENQFKATQLLLSNGAKLDLQDGTNQSFPYYIQSYCKDLPAIQSVLRTKIAQENISKFIPPCSEIQDMEYVADPLVFYFYKFCSSDKLIMILNAFSNSNIIKQDKEGNTILLLALKSRNNSLVEYLLDHFKGLGISEPRYLTSDFINTKNKIGETALFIAVNESKPKPFQRLLNLGASIEIEYPGGNTILHIAIATRNHEILQILLSLPNIGQLYCKQNDQGEVPIISLMKIEGVAFDAINKGQGTSLRGPNGESILHLVVKNGDKETLDKICNFRNVTSLLTVRDNEGQTPLHYAVIFNKIYAIGILIRLGLELSEPDSKKKTPIHYAIDDKNAVAWNAIMGILSKLTNVREIIEQTDQYGLTLLQHSIECNFLIAVKDILTLRPNLLPRHAKSNTIVHLAAESSEKADILSYLLDFINREKLPEETQEKLLVSKNVEQLPPLHYAIYNHNIEGVVILLKHGLSIVASIKRELTFFSGKLGGKLTLCKTINPKSNYLFGYIIFGKPQTNLVLVDIPSFQSTKVFPETSVQKVTSITEESVPLFLQTSCCDLINYLLQHKIIRDIFPSGTAPLHYAAQYSSENILSYLTTKHGHSPLVLDKQNNSLLYYALQNTNPQVLGTVCELLKSVKKSNNNPFEISNSEGKRILEICLDFDNLEGFVTLLPYISDLLYSNAKKLTLLYLIIQSNQGERFIEQFINTLIARCSAQKLREYANTLITIDKLTSLHCSIQKSNVRIVRAVLKLKPNLTITTHKGNNAIHLAAYIGNPSILELLLAYNTKDKSVRHTLVDSLTEDKSAMTPLHIAVLKGNNEILDILLLNKAQPTIGNDNGQTPLHLAVSCTTLPEEPLRLIITSLLRHPGMLSKQDNKGQTPVFCSIIESNLPVLIMFLEHSAVIDLNHRDKRGKSLIQHSIECRNHEIWKTIFNYLIKIDFFANTGVKYTFNLIESISLCIANSNHKAFTDLLGLNPPIPISGLDWSKLIDSSISQTDSDTYIVSIIRHLKRIQPNNWKDTYFYRESSPPLISAIQCGNIKAIEAMLTEQISLSFLDANNRLVLSSRANLQSLVICKKTPSLLLVGYGVSLADTSSEYLLVELPELSNTKLYSSHEISLLPTLATEDFITILRSQCIAPINRVLLSSSPLTVQTDGSCELVHLAAQYGSVEIIQQWLFQQKLEKLDRDGNSILYYALLHQNPNIFQAICNQMVHKKLYQLFNRPNSCGDRILDICIRRNHFESFHLLLDAKYGVELKYTDSNGYYLLHRIILLKSDVKFFINLHSVLRHTDLIGKAAGPLNLTHLHLAIVEHLPDYIEFMLANQYDLCVKSKGGNLPLHFAILYNFGEEILNKILNAIPKDKLSNCLNAQNNQGHAPLHLAVQNGNADNTERLLSIKCIQKEIADNLQRTALHYAVLLKGEDFDPKLISLLLQDTKLHHSKDSQGRTPVHYCIIESNLRALEAVFKLKKDTIDINDKDNEGKNIFHFAIESKSIPIWDIIFAELKVCPHSKDIIEDTLDKKTLLVHCIMRNNISAFKDILRLMPNTNTLDSQDNTPLHHVCTSSEQSSLLSSLQEHFEEFHKERIKEIFCYQNKDNLTPLHFAINNNNATAVRMLLKSKSPFVFLNKQQQQTLCALSSPLSLKLCQHRNNKNLMIGYAIILENKQTCWILTKIPEMESEAVEYENSEITEITTKTLDTNILKTILKCPSSEPLIAFFTNKLFSKDFQFRNNVHNLLHFAAIHGSLEVVKELCKIMDILLPDSNGDSVLFYALKNPQASILDFLLNNIIEVTRCKPPGVDFLNLANKSGKRLLEVALEMNNYDAFTVLLKTEFQVELTYTDANGSTLLLKIVQEHKDTKYLTSLLAEIRKRAPINLCTFVDFPTPGSSNTALHICISENLEELLKSLLTFSPNVSCENSEGNSPLHLASKDSYLSLIRILIEYVKGLGGDLKSFINAVNSEKLTPLHFAIIQFNSDIVMLLLTEGANLYAVNKSGKSVLHLAVEIERLETMQKAIEFLLNYERENSDMDNNLIRVQDKSGHTPLHLAVIQNKIEATQLLLGESPDLTIADKDEMTVLHHSIRYTKSEIFGKLIASIPSTNYNDPLHVLNLRDKNGNTAINLAINEGVEIFISSLLKLNLLLNLKNNSGQTPLHLAVLKPLDVLNCILEKIKENSETVTYLYATNNEGLPPLHFAIQRNRLESVEKLIEFGANLFFTDKKEFTTLYNGRGGLSMNFSKAKKGWFSKIFSNDTIFVGYKMDRKDRWIVSNLPELNSTTIVQNSEVEELTNMLGSPNTLVILSCACIEPIEVAIQNNLVDTDKKEGKGNWLNNLASKKGHKNVSKYLCNNLTIDGLCEMIKSGVTNADTFGDTLASIPTQHSYQTIPILTDSPTEEEKLIHTISITLCDTMLLSLDNVTPDALTKLLSLDPCLNFLYAESKSTLLHSMVDKRKTSDFLDIFLNKVEESKSENQENVKVNGVRIIDAKNGSSMTALTLSIQKRQEDNVKTLLKFKPDLTLCDGSKNSILHFAAKTGNVGIMDLIIAEILKSPELNYLFNDPNSNGCIPLHIAAETGDTTIFEKLLANGSEFYSQDNELRSILHHAILILAEVRRTPMIELILNNANNDKNTNNIVGLEDKQGQLPIHYAVERKFLASLRLLIPFTSTIKNKDAEGKTILHLASMHQDVPNTDIISCILTEISKQEANNPNSEWVTDRVIDFQDNRKKTPLHLCIDNRNHVCLAQLLTANPNLELVDAEENNLLHTAVEVVDSTRYLESISTLMSSNNVFTNLCTRLNSHGLPPLQYAILKNNDPAAEILVRKQASLAFHCNEKVFICGENGLLSLKIVSYKGNCWAGFRISQSNRECLIITELPDLTNTIFLKQNEARNIKPYSKSNKLTTEAIKQISMCKSCDPLNFTIQEGLITADTKLSNGLPIAPLISKHGTKEVVKKFCEIHQDTLYFEKSGNSMIESAVENPNIESLELLLSLLPTSSQPNEEVTSCVKNSLKLSLKNHNTNALETLLDYSKKVNYLYTEDNLTLLHLAIQETNSSDLSKVIFTKLNSEGTQSVFENVLFIDKQSKTSKQTALHKCIQLEKKDTLDILLSNSPDVFICDVNGNTALHFAVLHTQDLKFVETLHNFTQNKQKLLDIRNNSGYSALHLAVIDGNKEIVEFLLRAKAEFYPQELNEPTLLHLAINIKTNSIRGDVIEALLPYKKHLDSQCEMTQLKDSQGYPPLHLAVRLRTQNAVKLLLEADPSVLSLKNGDGHTPLHLSLIPQTVESGFTLPYCEVVFNEILGVIMSYTGCDICTTCQVNNIICTQDKRKRTAMHYAIQGNNVNALKTLLEKKTCLNIPDEHGNILLHEAVLNINDISCLKLVTEELELRYKDDNFLDCFKF